MGVADSVPTFVDDLLALSSAEGLTDTLRRERSSGRDWRTREPSRVDRNDRPSSWRQPGNVQTKLREYDSAFPLLQEALVIRRRLAEVRRAGSRTAASGELDAVVARDPTRRPLLFTRPPGTVFMVDEDGSHERQITETGDAPAWSADGRSVLFARLNGVGGIYLVNPDGTGLTQVTAPPPGWVDYGPLAFGNRVIFFRNDTAGWSMIYRVNSTELALPVDLRFDAT